MENTALLRVYATQLFAMAIKAQERGEASHADQLTMRAANYLDRATAIETPITQHQPHEK